MPGVVLAYSKKSSNNTITNICSEIAGRMYSREEFHFQDVGCDGRIFSKLLCRENDYSGISDSEEGFIVWFGRPLYKGKTLDEKSFTGIKDVIYSNGISDLLNDMSGHFQLVVFLKESKQCYVACDKASTHPIYYVETEEFIVFSPEPTTFKALNKYKWSPTVRRGAVFEYMASGYLWGDECFYDQVKRLGPGQLACIFEDGVKISSYWKMTFDQSEKTEQSLITELYEAIQRDIRNLPKGKKVLTLSGGYDSRALLGFLKNSDEQFDTVSYSFGSQANKGMDIDVGGYYADKVGASHSYYRASLDDDSRLIADIKDTVLATGGENYLSVFQDAFLGREFYGNLAEKYDYMIRGDEVWGWGDLAVNYDMAFWESRMFNLNEIMHPKKIMKPEMLERGVEYIRKLRKEFIEECGEPNISANDLKDYLYWRHREARLVQSMAYYRRCYVPHFAPFLFDRTLSVIKRTPSKHRIQKNLFMNMGKKMFPELFLDNKAISPHSSDVNNFKFLYKDKKFRSFVKGALLESGSDTFNELFDRKMFERWIDRILDGDPADVCKLRRKHDLKRLAVSFIGRSSYLKGQMKALTVKKDINTFPVLEVNYLFRLVVLSLALKEYE